MTAGQEERTNTRGTRKDTESVQSTTPAQAKHPAPGDMSLRPLPTDCGRVCVWRRHLRAPTAWKTGKVAGDEFAGQDRPGGSAPDTSGSIVRFRGLVNRLAAAGFPTPRALRTWCRLFIAGRLLEEPGRTVESIAEQLDFDSTTGLRNALKRYTGQGAGAVRAAGGLAHVLACFAAACDFQPPAAPAGGAHDAAAPGAAAHGPDHVAVSPPQAPSTAATIAESATHALLLAGALWLQFGILDGASYGVIL